MYSQGMRKTVSGFTLIEILIVTIIITIIASISTVVYTTVRNDADQKQAESLVGIVRASLEKYYNTTGDYPDPSTMNTDTIEANMLSVNIDTLNGGKFKFSPQLVNGTFSGQAANASHVSKIFYIARKADDLNANTATFNPSPACSVSLTGNTDADKGTSSYVLAFVRPGTTTWSVYRSAQGNATISPSSCKFDT